MAVIIFLMRDNYSRLRGVELIIPQTFWLAVSLALLSSSLFSDGSAIWFPSDNSQFRLAASIRGFPTQQEVVLQRDFEIMACAGVVRRLFISGWAWISPYSVILPDGGSRLTAGDMLRDAYFVQIKHCKGAERLSEGDKVTFDKHWNDRKQQYDIDNCTVLDGAACSPSGGGEEKRARIDDGGGEGDDAAACSLGGGGEEKRARVDGGGGQGEPAGAEGDAFEPYRKRPIPRTPDIIDGPPRSPFSGQKRPPPGTPSRGDGWLPRGRHQVTGCKCTGEGGGTAAVGGGVGGELPPRYTAAKGGARSRQ